MSSTNATHEVPRIGITTYPVDNNNRFLAARPYVDAVRRAGGLPLLLPPGENRLDALFTAIDGLILTGGGDIEPRRYGAERDPRTYGDNDERDEQELAMVPRALELALPLLAVCRGVQILNVALGGTLIQHLPDVVGNSVAHRNGLRGATTHAVAIDADSRLARTLGAARCSVASWHHQAIDALGNGLRVAARSTDDLVIEAVELDASRDDAWLAGVQWHPELTAATDAVQQRLFQSLVNAASTHGRLR
ncbi:MAG: gamma-glutamyl-gamma-aminobutyrate hydrolase family protein [Planctomycetes bacterium]|nr:gamma-glutamyl-gamma-aminobutyrate hydrolase family protein [Planctomycetota bacterium]